MIESDVLVIVVENKKAAQYLSIDAGFKRVIVVCLKRDDTDAVFEIAKELTNAHVSKVSFSNIAATASDIYAKLGRAEPNPMLFFRSAVGSRKEINAAKMLKEELSRIINVAV